MSVSRYHVGKMFEFDIEARTKYLVLFVNAQLSTGSIFINLSLNPM
mgnify:CR=1 FL=1